MKLQQYSFLILLFFLFSCAANKNLEMDSEDIIIEDDISSSQNSESLENTSIEPSNPFYPLKESIYDIQNQVNELRSKVIEYESELHNPSIDIELLKMLKSPEITHAITLNNGTIIQGSIISESSDAMIVQTQIGQLTIEKELIVEINEVDPIMPNLEFIENEIEERIEQETYTYVGKITNTGGLRADFVRVIYHFWADNTSPVITDSVYISGNSMVYLNGVISDAALEPTSFGDFSLSILLPDSLNIEYHTKEVNWDIYK